MRIAIKFAYNGLNYHGFARQPNVKTIEEIIHNSLKKHEIIKNIKDANFRYASRTDKGVSAISNIFAFDTKSEIDILKKLYDECDDIVFYGIKNVNPTFNPRHAKQRFYRYHYKINTEEIHEFKNIIDLFKGEHDFTNFARVESKKNGIRNIEDITIRERDDFVIIDFYAQSFLWHQIRKIISAVTQVINHKIDINDIKNGLEFPNLKVDYGLASPEPLLLMDVIYDFNFVYFNKAINRLNELKKTILGNIKYQSY
jgi:tRNA pseudouridine38-40 synthase